MALTLKQKLADANERAASYYKQMTRARTQLSDVIDVMMSSKDKDDKIKSRMIRLSQALEQIKRGLQ